MESGAPRQQEMAEEILIVGGGFAGLAAGVALAGAGRRVRLIEQHPYLGGRARSFRDPATGSVVDNGQHIFMGCYRATLRFLAEIGSLQHVAFQPRLKLTFLEPPGRLTTVACPELPAPWHLLAGVLRSQSFSFAEKLQVMRLGSALAAESAGTDGVGSLTVEEWLARLGQSEKLRRKFWDLLCIAAMNEDPRRASAAVFERVLQVALFRSSAGSCLGLARVGLSECYAPAAASYIAARGGQVELNHQVKRLLVSDSGCEGAEVADGRQIRARVVVSAVPWFELLRLLPDGLVSSEPFFGRLMRLRSSPIISINVWFDRPVTDVEFAALRGTTIQWLFNKGRLLSLAQHYVSLVLSGAHEHIGRSRDELLQVALRDLRDLLPAARDAKVVHSLILKERFATFSPDCGAEELRPGAVTPVRHLYLAGDWTATGLPATIEGAVQSGYAAASEITALLERS